MSASGSTAESATLDRASNQESIRQLNEPVAKARPVEAYIAEPALQLQREWIEGRASARICVNDPPEYPGCTASQFASLEAGTKWKAKRSYKAKRWGQKRHAFKKVGKKANRILKRAWKHAKRKWLNRHPDQRLVIRSWKAYRHKLADGGCTSLGWMPSVSFWCHFNKEFNHDIVDHSGRVVGNAALRCGGAALITNVLGGIGDAIKTVALTWRAAAARGVMGCLAGLFSKYFTKLYD